MVQSVHRALRLLEALDQAGPAGAPLSSLAQEAALKAPTAHNLLATLVDLGYATREANDHRYRLGERSLALGTGKALLARLVHAGRGPARRLADISGETVVLAVDLADQRHSVLCCESRQQLSVRADTGVDDHFYDTATGRILLALRSPESSAELIRVHGLPGALWPAAEDERGLCQCLQDIRAAGQAELTQPASHVRALAVPVGLQIVPVGASLGLFYPTARDPSGRMECLLQQLHVAAAEIEVAYERV